MLGNGSGAQPGSGAPPTLLLSGLADHLLPADVAFGFAAKTKAAAIDVRLIALPHGEPSFDQMSGSIGSQFIRGTLLNFLAQHDVAP